MLRVTVDHPDGVSLAVCEQVTADLDELRERFGLEVSSPGPERPLLRPEHFVRYAGRRASLRLVDGAAAGPKVVGEIVEADESSVVLNADGERLTLPYDLIDRANLTAA
jgi:ribosome maturation factor RimP